MLNVLVFQVGYYVLEWKDNHYKTSLKLKSVQTILLMCCLWHDQTPLCPEVWGNNINLLAVRETQTSGKSKRTRLMFKHAVCFLSFYQIWVKANLHLCAALIGHYPQHTPAWPSLHWALGVIKGTMTSAHEHKHSHITDKRRWCHSLPSSPGNMKGHGDRICKQGQDVKN